VLAVDSSSIGALHLEKGDMALKFLKMHGLGNDYIVMEDLAQRIKNPGALSQTLSRRHEGVGSDGLILIWPSQACDFKMGMYNADGSEGEMCGNGIRCLGQFVYEQGLTDKQSLLIETKAGVRRLNLQVEGGKVPRIQVDMGVPELAPQKIPVAAPGDLFVEQPIVIDGMTYPVTCVSMGNPHAVLFLDGIAALNLSGLGPKLERHPLFPNRINVEFVHVADRSNLHLRVWERGSGETMACGTGACAAVVAGVVTGRCARHVNVHLPGGILDICWEIAGGHVQMTGPVKTVFEGEILDDESE
jgi:diaminopimelate epimerase